MTPRQQQLLAFLRARRDAGLVPPSYDEIAAHLGLKSKSNICRLIETLLRDGLVRKSVYARSIELVERPADYERGYRDGYAAVVETQRRVA